MGGHYFDFGALYLDNEHSSFIVSINKQGGGAGLNPAPDNKITKRVLTLIQK
jgi:hypothetical protein